MRSLRWRLMIATAAATALILGLCGIILDASIRATLSDEFNSTLTTNARAMLPLINQRGSKIVIDPSLMQLSQFRKPLRPEYFEVRDVTANTMTPSQSLGDGKLSMASPSDESALQSLALPDLRPGRAVAIRFTPQMVIDQSEEAPPVQHTFVLVLGRDTLDLLDTLRRTRLLLLVVCSIATLASTLLMAVIIQRGLRSTGKLASRIAGINDATLAQRIEIANVPTELMPVVHRLNDLLQRLQDTFEREKSFSSDVAHELRTPLAGLETALEVSASQKRSPEEYDRVIHRCLDVCRRMHAMVDNLLTLARAESKQLVVSREPVDLADLCREAWTNFQPRADERKLRIEWRLADDCFVTSDREKLRLLFNNFFDNAVSYTDLSGSITISADCKTHPRIAVSNTGSRLSSADASHVFERFWRGDRARTAGTHCGLGLTLCRNIVQVLGGTIEAKSDSGRFTVTVELPESAVARESVSAQV